MVEETLAFDPGRVSALEMTLFRFFIVRFWSGARVDQSLTGGPERGSFRSCRDPPGSQAGKRYEPRIFQYTLLALDRFNLIRVWLFVRRIFL